MSYILTNAKKNINIKNVKSLIKKYQPPFWVYDADIIYEKIKLLKNFDVIRFAQKSCSNINILRLMKNKNLKIDAVSLGEIERALSSGFQPNTDEIIFTADILDQETLSKVINFNIPVNAGSLDMLTQLGKSSPGHHVWLRINPGFGYGHSKKTNTGGENSKHGIWEPRLAIPIIKKYKLKLIGLHMHIGSGVNYIHLKKVCKSMVQYALQLNQKISSISAGGGLPIPYQIDEKPIDIKKYFMLWNNARKEISRFLDQKIELEIEPGRFLVAESGILISKVWSVKKMGKKNFILIDVGFNDFMRPTMYGSYHHISIISGDNREINENEKIDTVVGGPLCESGDIFTQKEGGTVQTRKLPIIKVGDYLIFHDTGAYGASMSSNYNTRPLIPEILLENNNSFVIRRRQKIEEILNLEK
ncbi:diaminopimelate decarboxylase [Buchnera aphidicola]|uniref:Diaminopimelate decarboxylase n=1 Tax=Buchnera aphidicola str. USDA (Myzus persicae) TaxID=1009856 RepID=W0P3D4_BUCMP|nr:diaminopimelate decarboxylase [Buchnera aphidicola]AHG59957.1 Lysa [Buchnera aphidicola str. USDA (Myzus persicae)]AHG60537.1 Lysa [Buchnera aphidicola str. W106 (Myzus persicae)]AHG61110.1 Lysa [Buchnera aphidicola str. G002 (Myzus persicae)]AHG61682.1 Lysa [Buchnera aphidicola str. F009 (Myzus persicae)]WAI03360.1 MAG: diaminopimelate decarboxylase [Buchnera aphidicola (Myzus persicae)]